MTDPADLASADLAGPAGPADAPAHARSAQAASPSGQIACTVCAMNPLCHPRSSPADASSLVECRRRLRAGETLYRAGTPRASIYAVRAGFLTVRAPAADGTGHIVRFLLPGDAAGLDGFASGIHQSEAVALGDSEVCEIPAYRAEILADFRAAIGAHLRGLLARELGESHQHAAALARLTAAQRVAQFLLHLSQRWLERGYSGCAFRLPMTRREMGDHLGLTMETVSRVMSDFQARGWIALARDEVKIRAEGMLRASLQPSK